MKATSVPLRPRTSASVYVFPSRPRSAKSRAFQPNSQIPGLASTIATSTISCTYVGMTAVPGKRRIAPPRSERCSSLEMPLAKKGAGMSQELLYQVDEAVATITFNRPERMNALTHELEAELHRRLDEADADRAVRVIMLTGAGRAFCAGYDQAQTGKSGTRHSDPKGKSHAEFIEFWHRVDAARVGYWTHMWGLGKPIIAAVNGWGMGGGFWYQLAADITIASDQAVFAQPEVRHISNTTFLFAALCGWKAANRYALTGDHFDAQEAFRIGLVNEVVPHDQLLPRARRLAERIAMVPEASVRLNKAITMRGLQAA